MPTYQWICDRCKMQWEIKLTFEQHENIKDNYTCNVCGEKARQVVTPLNFRLKGEGWFGNNSDAVASPYALTQTELNKNLEQEKRVEDYANTMSARDENRKEL